MTILLLCAYTLALGEDGQFVALQSEIDMSLAVRGRGVSMLGPSTTKPEHTTKSMQTVRGYNVLVRENAVSEQ